ncbi:MAG: hypothetical protein ACFHU9_15645 [Fluviicola sp.]
MKEEKDIFDFIEKRRIETPDSSYFKDLADKVIADTSASRLRSMPSESDQISSAANQQKAKIIPLYRRPVAWVSGVAAAILVAFLLLPGSPEPSSKTDQLANATEPSREEVLAYVNDNIDDFDEELLIEFIAMKNLKSDPVTTEDMEPENEPLETIIETETKGLQQSLEQISEEEILEYLELEGELDEDDEFLLL